MKKLKTTTADHGLTPQPSGLERVELITTDALAQMIHWHRESVRRAIRQGRLRAVKLGRGWRVPADVIAEILRNGIPTNPN